MAAQHKPPLFIDRQTLLTTLVCLLPIAYGFVASPLLPEVVPRHWPVGVFVNSYVNIYVAIFDIPFLSAGANVFTHMFVNSRQSKSTPPRYSNLTVTLLKWAFPIASNMFSLITLLWVVS